MIEIEPLNRAGLCAYVDNPRFDTLPDLPISRHRARSQVNNPRAADDDVLLLLAHLRGELVGYLGVLPDCMFLPGGATERVGWLSCIWVSPAARGQGVSGKLIGAALDAWDRRVWATEYVPGIRKLYDRTGAFGRTPHVETGLRLYVRSDLRRILPPKRPALVRWAGALGTIDGAVNRLLDARPQGGAADFDPRRVAYVDRVDDEVAAFVAARQGRELFRRGQAELNWMFDHPWLHEGPPTDDQERRYYFSAVARSFRRRGITIRDAGGVLRAFMVVQERDGVLKLPYCYHDAALGDVVRVLNAHLRRGGVTTFTTYHRGLARALLAGRTPALVMKPVVRPYLYPQVFAEALAGGTIDIQDGDGDCGFT
ncbi:MAG: GNAT family N-acetyltransferase [Catalinimonas sp.]